MGRFKTVDYGPRYIRYIVHVGLNGFLVLWVKDSAHSANGYFHTPTHTTQYYHIHIHIVIICLLYFMVCVLYAVGLLRRPPLLFSGG